MSINNRIKKIREHFYNDSNKDFSIIIGKSEQYASNLTKEGKSVGKNVITSLTNAIPNLNVSWLLTGEGEMLKEELSNSVPVLNENELILRLVDEGKVVLMSTYEREIEKRDLKIDRLQNDNGFYKGLLDKAGIKYEQTAS